MKLVLVDADLVVYSAAFCVEAKEKEGVYLNWYQVSKIVDTIYAKILRDTKATHHMGFLTEGKSNFRLARATTLPYKGQRKTNKEKPKFYDEIRHYLEIQWGCQVMRGIEADDALVIVSEYFKERKDVTTIIATKDKDLWQYAGLHYDMNVNKMKTISEEEAHRNLWKQMMLGDLRTDNIPGLSHAAKWEVETYESGRQRPQREFQWGEVRVKNFLKDNDPADYPRLIFELYIDAYQTDDDDLFGELRFYETFDLIYMLRELPKGVELHYNPLLVKKADLWVEEDMGETKKSRAPLAFEDESEEDF